MTITLFVLDVEDFRPLARVAAKSPDVKVVKRGHYYEVSSDKAFEIDRDATGCRNAVWFSSVAAIRAGHLGRWDKEVLRIEPGNSPDPGANAAESALVRLGKDESHVEALERDTV
jgi:hypothetical protein